MVVASASNKGTSKEQLLRLYWNRASVKRQLKSLQQERHELLDRLKDSESQVARAQEQLDGLERLLVNPIAAANAMVYFQLRNVWRVASQRLEQFSVDIEQDRLERERKALQDSAISKRQRRLAAIEENTRNTRCERTGLSAEAEKLEASLARMHLLKRLFRRRAVESEIDGMRAQVESLTNQLREFDELAEKLEGEPLPEVEDLSIENRRYVNTAVIALAQHLVVHFSPNRLAQTSREAMRRTVGEMRFGDRRECDRMVESIRSRIADLKAESKLAELVRQRAARISTELQYRSETDTVPGVFSLNRIMPSANAKRYGRRSADAAIEVNVLADDYWDLSRHLI
ncbi:MAG TPA: hypothetical protein VKQ06_00035 [Gammaproteobacteria bacterium]|nr:hypothetical protein [Gammaproteobacteria bacterium]